MDDVFVIVLFAAFTGLAQGEAISPMSFVQIPVSIVLGILVGLLCGVLLSTLFKKVHMRDSAKVLILFSMAFLFVTA